MEAHLLGRTTQALPKTLLLVHYCADHRRIETPHKSSGDALSQFVKSLKLTQVRTLTQWYCLM